MNNIEPKNIKKNPTNNKLRNLLNICLSESLYIVQNKYNP